MEQNEHNNHSGIGSIAGFVYQDYFFLFKLLTCLLYTSPSPRDRG